MNDIQKLIGLKIKDLRKDRNISQEKLAELLNVTPSSVSNIETGKRAISIKTLSKIAEIFKVDFYELFLFDENAKPKEVLLKMLYKNIESKNIKDNVKNLIILYEMTEKLK